MLCELALDRRAALGHLVVGERAVGRAELEPQGQRLVALPHLLAAVEVEDRERRRAGRRRPCARPPRPRAPAPRPAPPPRCPAARRGSSSRRCRRRGRPRASSASVSKSSSNAATGPSRSHARTTSGMQLADPAELALARGRTAAARPGCRNGGPPGLGLPIDARDLEQPPRAAPGRRRSRPARGGCASRRARPAVTSAPRWWRSSAGVRPARRGVVGRRRTGRTWADSNSATPARPCAALWRAASSRPGSSSGRITLCSSLSGLSRRSSGSSPSRSRSSVSRRGEAVRRCTRRGRGRAARPRAAGAGAGAGSSRPTACRRARAASWAACRGRGCARPPRSGRPRAGRRQSRQDGTRQPPVRPASKPSRREDLAPRAPAGSRSPEQPLDPLVAQRHDARLAPALGIDVDRAGHQPRAAQLHHQPRRQPLRRPSPARGGAASRSAPRPRCAARAPSRCA